MINIKTVHKLFILGMRTFQTESLMLNSKTWNNLGENKWLILFAMCKQMICIRLDRNTWLLEILMFKSNTRNHLSVWKQMNSNSLNNQITN